MKSVILIARKNRSQGDEPKLPGQLQSSTKGSKGEAWQGQMNSTRRDTHTQAQSAQL